MTRAGRVALVALTATLAIQIYTSLAGMATSVLAPEVARDLAIAPKWVGVFVGLLYAGAVAGSLVSGVVIGRYGAIRVSQASVLLCALGSLGVALVPTGAPVLLVVAALVIGIGYGPITPASSHVLVRTAPPARMALTFSIKQTGVPAGAALAGALLPAVAITAGWRVALAGVAVAGVAIALAAQATRRELDQGTTEVREFSLRAVMEPVRVVLAHPVLRELSLVGCAYAATQVCLTSFLVVFLTEALGWSLVAAGFALAAATLGGVAGRIVWGAIADRAAVSRSVLGAIGVIAGACGAAMALAAETWPTSAMIALITLYGATAIGWNGVQLADLARHAPAGKAGAITGASGVVTFAGVVFGPPLFALLSAASGGYRAGFAVLAMLSATAGLGLALRRRR